ncbi:hypothetical protein [Streptomyces sp. CNQ085]|uniref:hypothetical protein n=1 Tax=Streptomyces sp. CNQ085 TaxID=2886944 RepID=UPI001F50A5EF|nr:hypothetical protein [Streptomyces sp. CNQ085]MCI0386188.1 hypothetical protein [Streptomyces sp. CNQ085]
MTDHTERPADKPKPAPGPMPAILARLDALKAEHDRAVQEPAAPAPAADNLRQQLAAAILAERDRKGGCRNVTALELADAITAETKRLMQRRTTTLRKRAERAEAALQRVRALTTEHPVTIDTALIHTALDPRQ